MFKSSSSDVQEIIDAVSNDAQSEPNREAVEILVIGSWQGVDRIVHHLHQLGFAEFGEWSRLLPAPSGEVMRILVRDVCVD